MIWFLYVVRTVDSTLYTGITTDVQRRYKQHVLGGATAARYLCAHPPVALVFSTPVGSRSLALKVEYRFKRLTKEDKERVVREQQLHFDEETGKVIL